MPISIPKKQLIKPSHAMITKVLGLMEEKGKTKDWLLEELKKHRINSKILQAANSSEILQKSDKKVVEHIKSLLTNEFFEIEEINTLTKTLHWFFTDIVGGSDPTMTVKAQSRKIQILNMLITNSSVFSKTHFKDPAVLPTGDGVAIGFGDSPEEPLLLAIELHKAINKYNKSKENIDKIFIRVGIDSGPAYFINGIGDSPTFWGPGIIMARRVMDLCDPNQILASSRIADDLKKLSTENQGTMREIGKHKVKHGEEIIIYNISGSGFGTTNVKKKTKEGNNKFKSEFEFKEIEIKLEVKNTKTMMTHHTWIWNVKNISENPIPRIFYHLHGDVPRDFKSLNIIAHDKKNNELKMDGDPERDKPTEKKFYMMFKKPLQKNQSQRVKLEFDWEETDNTYVYDFSTKCENFKYYFSIPKGRSINNRILKVVDSLNEKIRVETPAKITYGKKKTEIRWNSGNNPIYPPYSLEFTW